MARVRYHKAKDLPAMYHLSFRKDLAGLWRPQLPAGSELPSGDYPEPEIPRVSIAPSIEGCFRAIYPNIADLYKIKKYPYLTFYVYAPIFTGREWIVGPTQLTHEQWVWDAHVTQEHWVTESVKMGLIGQIKVINTSAGRDLLTHPFDNPKLPLLRVGPAQVKWSWLSAKPQVALEDYQTPIWEGW